MTQQEKTIVIVGGGFGGIRTALELDRAKLPNTRVILIHDRSHFEYHPALYRIISGGSPFEVCIPLDDIFAATNVLTVKDRAVDIDPDTKTITGASGSTYRYDHAVLALGSQTDHLGIEGLEEYSISFKSIHDALLLKRHIQRLIEEGSADAKDVRTRNIVVVGGGATGVETAATLAAYTRDLVQKHDLPENFFTVQLIDAQDRVLPRFPKDISFRAQKALQKLGVRVLLNRTVVKEDVDELYLDNESVKTGTVIWAAGVKTNEFYEKLPDLKRNEYKTIVVDRQLRAEGYDEIYLLGDAIATKYSGMAQTAEFDGAFIARVLTHKILGKELPTYTPREPIYTIPVGRKSALVLWKGQRFGGYIGWLIRRVADLRHFLSILPAGKAWRAFREKGVVCEDCPTCEEQERNN